MRDEGGLVPIFIRAHPPSPASSHLERGATALLPATHVCDRRPLCGLDRDFIDGARLLQPADVGSEQINVRCARKRV